MWLQSAWSYLGIGSYKGQENKIEKKLEIRHLSTLKKLTILYIIYWRTDIIFFDELASSQISLYKLSITEL